MKICQIFSLFISFCVSSLNVPIFCDLKRRRKEGSESIANIQSTSKVRCLESKEKETTTNTKKRKLREEESREKGKLRRRKREVENTRKGVKRRERDGSTCVC